MKVTTKAGDLAGAMALAAQVLETKTAVEILNAVHIVARADNIRLAVNVLNRALTLSVTAEVATPGEIAVPAKALAGLTRGLPRADRITIESGDKSVRVSCGRSRFTLPTMPVAHLPAMPAIDVAAGEIELDRKGFLAALEAIGFAASRDELRNYIHGVLLHDDDGHLALVATDGQRLAKRWMPSASFSPDLRCILPLATVATIAKLLSKTKADTITLRRSRALVELICAPDFVFVSKLIDATFPDYKRIIPPTPTNGATVARSELAAALARLGAMVVHSSERAAVVGFLWDPNDPVLRLSLPYQPDAVDDVLPASVFGTKSIWTGVQARHVGELIDGFGGESITVATDDNNTPILITDPMDATGFAIQSPCRPPGSSPATREDQT